MYLPRRTPSTGSVAVSGLVVRWLARSLTINAWIKALVRGRVCRVMERTYDLDLRVVLQQFLELLDGVRREFRSHFFSITFWSRYLERSMQVLSAVCETTANVTEGRRGASSHLLSTLEDG